jgi:hypothetical protein
MVIEMVMIASKLRAGQGNSRSALEIQIAAELFLMTINPGDGSLDCSCSRADDAAEYRPF